MIKEDHGPKPLKATWYKIDFCGIYMHIYRRLRNPVLEYHIPSSSPASKAA